MQNVAIGGGGFAGLWTAVAAVPCPEQLGLSPSRLAITLGSRDPFLTIRPRLYESEPCQMRIPLDGLLI